MHNPRNIALTLAAVALSSLMLVSTAAAAEPAAVTVRVEGSSETLLPPTQVTTTTVPVVKDGNSSDSCPGEDALGALDVATKGNWGGKWEASFHEYVVETILGESHPFSGPTYWEFWIDNVPSEVGTCNKELKNGDTLLFFPGCFGECPPPSNPLGIEVAATAATATKVPVTVTSYANGTGTPSPAAGASISYEGKTAETDSAGHATLEFTSPGEQELKVTKAQSVRTEATVCVHAGNDGTCGATRPVSSGAPAPAPAAPYKGPYALVADVASVLDGHVYRAGHGPRLISGRVTSHSAVSSVSIALHRIDRNRCSAFDAARGRFVHARCGTAKFFAVSKEAAFSYLLPKALSPGRYVLDIKATDTAGNTTTLARGTSRLVFYVR